MRMVFLLLVVQLLIGCTTKHKLLGKSQELVEIRTTDKTEVETLNKKSTALYYIDSANYKQWLKIYPKGMVSIGQSGFVGEVDSFIWLNNGASYQRKNAFQEQRVQQRISKSTDDSIAYSKRAYIKEKKKIALSFWSLTLLIGLAGSYLFAMART